MLALGQAALLGRRTALSIAEDELVQDADGFDDIDAFWEAARARTNTSKQLVVLPPTQTSAKRRTSVRTPRSPDDWSPALVSKPTRSLDDDPVVDDYDPSPLESARSKRRRSDDIPPADEAPVDDNSPPADEEDDSMAVQGDDTPPVDEDDSRSIEEAPSIEEDDAPPAHVESPVKSKTKRPAEPVVEHEGLRRSRRQKFQPLKWWKSERLIYQVDEQTAAPEVVAVQLGAPTPKPVRREGRGTRRVATLAPSSGDADAEAARLWDEPAGKTRDWTAVARVDKAFETKLPVSSRHHADAPAGLAAQAFNTPASDLDDQCLPAWISGHVLLPPNAIKDEESVDLCGQVFFVARCSPTALELAYADPDDVNGFVATSAQRFLLSAGDQFHVPPNNVYRLHNRSDSEDCLLFWIIIKPLDMPLARRNKDADED